MRRARPDSWKLVLAGVLLLCAVVRLKWLSTAAGDMNGDEAVSALASQDVLEGTLRTFYPGQIYMGTLEQTLAALPLALLEDGDISVRLTQVLLAVATCATVLSIAARCGMGRLRTLTAGVLFAIGPYFLIEFGSRTMGAYATTILLGALGVRLALGTSRPALRAAAFGLVCGLGLWENPQAAYLLAPAGLWLMASWRGNWARALPAFGLGAVVGMLPVLVFIVENGVPPGLLGLSTEGPGGSTFEARWSVFYNAVLPQFLGLRLVPNGVPVETWFPAGVLVLVAAGALGAGVWAMRQDLLDAVRLRGADRRPTALILLCLALAPLLYAGSERAVLGVEPRYLFGLYPMYALALALLVPRTRVGGPLVAGLLVVAFGWLTMQNQELRSGGLAGYRSEAAKAAAKVLVEADQPFVWGDYFIVSQVEFFSQGRVTASAFVPQRFPGRARAVAAAPRPAYLTGSDAGAEVFGKLLRDRGISYRPVDVRGLVVFLDLEPPTQAWELGLAPRP